VLVVEVEDLSVKLVNPLFILLRGSLVIVLVDHNAVLTELFLLLANRRKELSGISFLVSKGIKTVVHHQQSALQNQRHAISQNLQCLSQSVVAWEQS